MPYKHLSKEERKVIFYLRMEDLTLAEIGRRLGRSASTISRELRRHLASPDDEYNDLYAQDQYERAQHRQRKKPKTSDRVLLKYVRNKLHQEWSPEQISGRLREVDIIGKERKTISHQTIYRWVRKDKQSGGALYKRLRYGHKKHRKPYGVKRRRGPIADRTFIDDRPGIVDHRSRIGDWEGDTVIGKRQRKAIMTMVERASGYLVTRKMNDRSSGALNDALVNGMQNHDKDNIRTITFDNGAEFAQFKEIKKIFDCDVYFAHPFSSWERGTNENTNGLLRQYIPKGTDLEKIPPKMLAMYTKRINNRPRKRLQFWTPCEVYRMLLLHLLC